MLRIYVDNGEVVADESENDTSISMVEIKISVTDYDLSDVTESCFLEGDGCISIEAPHFNSVVNTAGGQYKEIENFGKTLGGMKAYPQTLRFESETDAPALIYKVYAAKTGTYTCNIYTAPSNPVVYRGKLELGVVANDGKSNIVNTIPEKGFEPWKSMSWRQGVLDNIHIGSCQLELKEGLNEIKLFAIDPAVVIEKIVLWNPAVTPRESYLGPKESKNYKGFSNF